MPDPVSVSPSPSIAPATIEERETILDFVRKAAFAYGVWNRFKGLYKAAEAEPSRADAAVLGALLARIDDSPLTLGDKQPQVAFGDMQGVRGIAERGGYLLAVGGRTRWRQDLMRVFTTNSADPMHPTQVAELGLTTNGNSFGGMALCGGVLCFLINTYSNWTIYRIDVSDPLRPRGYPPVLLESAATIADGDSATPRLYVMFQSQRNNAFTGLRIFDVSSAGLMPIIGELAIRAPGEEAGGFAAEGSLAAIVMKPVGLTWRTLPRSGGIQFIDVSAPSRPTLRDAVSIPGASCVALRDGFAYVGVSANTATKAGLQVVDVQNPNLPRKAGFLPLDSIVTGVTTSPDGQFIYAHTQAGVLQAVDVRDPAAPRVVETLDGLYGATGLVLTEDGQTAYAPTEYAGVALVSLARPDKPQRVGAPPSADTIGYLKRRGRRFLRGLAKSDPARYAEIATEFLAALPGKDKTIDGARHWAAIDVLFGGGARFRQTRHGRGRYVAIGDQSAVSKLALRTREERSPEVWAAHPELLARLLRTPDLLPPVYAFAARALRASGQPLPLIADAILEQWLSGGEPLLVALAVRATVGRLAVGETPAPTLAADAFFSAGAATRRKLATERGGAWAAKRTWAEAFALRLASRVTPTDAGQTALSKRQRDGSALLARYFGWALSARPDVLLPLVAPFLASGRDDLRALIASGAANVAQKDLVAWLMQLGRVTDPALREPVLASLASGMKAVTLSRQMLRGFVFHADAFVREGGWRLIAASATGGDLLRETWNELLLAMQATPALTTAMSSADALGLLERAGIDADALAGYLAERPFLVELLSPDAFGAVASRAPASVVLSLVAASPDARWEMLRPVWLRLLREGVGLETVWLAAEAALTNDATGRLEARLLADAEIAETFLGVEDDVVLAIREPAFGAILAAWVERHLDRFTKNSTLLYDAATHPLPEVRTPALARVQSLGLEMPFALRLMESALPPSVVVGQAFFDAEPTGGDREPDYALALCDSPAAPVRAFGRGFVDARWATLPHERILLALFENPDPAMQAFVADKLAGGTDADVPTAAIPLFNAEVLRSTNRARIAKERIKARQTGQAGEPSVDVATLLTVARGRTPRDAEWALGELARRVARGEAIDGVVVEGVVGV